jgi:hypothetical protein
MRLNALAAMVAYVCLRCVDAYAAEPVACSLLTQQQISAAVGAAVGTGAPIAAPTSCQWSGEGKTVTLTINHPRGGQSPVDQFNAGKASSLPGIATEPVSGVGEDAYYVYFEGTKRAGCGLMVKKASSAFEIRVYGFDLDQAKVVAKTIAQSVANRL